MFSINGTQNWALLKDRFWKKKFCTFFSLQFLQSRLVIIYLQIKEKNTFNCCSFIDEQVNKLISSGWIALRPILPLVVRECLNTVFPSRLIGSDDPTSGRARRARSPDLTQLDFVCWFQWEKSVIYCWSEICWRIEKAESCKLWHKSSLSCW